MSEENIKNVKRYIDNVIWHISTNRKTQNNDSRMLDDVYDALKNMQELLTKDG